MKKYSAVLFLCWICLQAGAQGSSGNSNDPQLQSVIPVSPNAAALGKYGAMPVGTYTGIPEISVPVYEINTGKIRLPISVSYHAGGIKVEEMASWVGLGWSLNAGGSISRQTRGRPDESSNGFLERHADVRRYLNNQMSVSERVAFLQDAVSGDVDTQPDIFYYNTPGGAGSFFYDTTGSIVTIPVSRQLIQGGGNAWQVLDVDGTQYIFEAAEQTTSTPATGSLQSTEHGYLGATYTSVFLSRIISADGSEEVHFYYDSTIYSFDAISSQTRHVIASPYSTCPAIDPSTVSMTNTIYGRRLKKITFNGGEILFNAASSDRTDLPGDRALDNIVIHNSDSSFFKKVRFYYSYWAGSGNTNQNNSGTDELYRLFLDSVGIEDGAAKKVERYAFDYTPGTLPRRTSFNQDYWGYYNGADNGNNFVPTTYLPTASGVLGFRGANRNTSANFSQIGMLNKITYPTGGSTHFEYENNLISTTTPGTIYNTQETGFLSLGTTTNATVFTGEFTIDGFGGEANATVPVTVVLNNGGCGGTNQTLGCPLVNLSLSGTVGSVPVTSSGIIQVAPGTYTLTADLSDVTDQNVFNSFYVTLSWPKPLKSVYNGDTVYQRLDGGHRIKKIYDEDAFGDTMNVKSYSYNLPGTEISSGSVLSIPEYISDMHKIIIDNTIQDQTHVYDCAYKIFSSASNYPLLSTKGSYVGYSFVKETLGAGGSGGVNEYSYTSPASIADINYSGFPYAPSTSYDWERGVLLKQVVRKKTASGFEPVQEKYMTYSEHNDYMLKGLKVGFNGTDYVSQDFDLATGWYTLDADSVVQYDQADASRKQVVVNRYGYSQNAMQANLIVTDNSKGEQIISKTKFPVDYPNYTGSETDALGIQELKVRNMVTLPIEKKVIKKTGTTYKTISGMLTSYNAALAKPVALWQLFPGAVADTSMSTIGTGGLQKDNAYEKRINLPEYTSSKNLLSQYKQDDVKHSYVWDYGELYPIAECINATPGVIAYTSFEADGRGGWTGIGSGSITGTGRAITGKRYYYQNNFSISKSGLDNTGSYIVSYWAKGGSYTVSGTQSGYPKTIGSITLGTDTWTQYEHLVSGQGSVTITGSGALDELRLYPKDAQMTTCTYTPLLGMTSKCDAAGRISYFEYDSLGRLLRIRDQNDRILKAYEYKYASQQ